MAIVTTYNFTTAGNYTAGDSNYVEVTGGVGTLKDLIPTDETFLATYTSGLDALRGDGTLTATTEAGSPTTSEGNLSIPGDNSSKISYDAQTNLNITGPFTARWDFEPQWTGQSSGSHVMFDLHRTSGNVNRVLVYYNSITLNMVVYDGSASLVTSTGNTDWSPVLGTSYEFEFNCDPATGAVRLFIDGALILERTGSAFTMAAYVNERVDIGPMPTNEGQFSYMRFFDTIQHTAAYTGSLSVAPLDTQYTTVAQSLLTNTYITGSVSSISASTTVAGSDAVTYVINVAGQDKYWDGSAWSNSTGVAQSNTEADFNENIGVISTSNDQVKFKVYLDGDDGTTTPTITSLAVTYDATDESATTPTSVYLEGWLYDFNGPQSSVTIEVRPAEGFVNEEIFITHSWQTFNVTASDGYFSGRIYQSASVTKQWEFRINGKKFRVTIPDQAVVKWSDLTITVVENT